MSPRGSFWGRRLRPRRDAGRLTGFYSARRQTVTQPLRIGILRAARIAEDGIIDPARALGHDRRGGRSGPPAGRGLRRRARHRERARQAIRSVDDPDVDVVYNSRQLAARRVEHAALRAGKHVLSEKPMSSNAAQARESASRRAHGQNRREGFHSLPPPREHTAA